MSRNKAVPENDLIKYMLVIVHFSCIYIFLLGVLSSNSHKTRALNYNQTRQFDISPAIPRSRAYL